jgi:hypothetical protein
MLMIINAEISQKDRAKYRSATGPTYCPYISYTHYSLCANMRYYAPYLACLLSIIQPRQEFENSQKKAIELHKKMLKIPN